VKPGGVARGLHPTEGRINGRYEISDDGILCVTWPLSSGAVKNCDKTSQKAIKSIPDKVVFAETDQEAEEPVQWFDNLIEPQECDERSQRRVTRRWSLTGSRG
jgi:hypothetical protein